MDDSTELAEDEPEEPGAAASVREAAAGKVRRWSHRPWSRRRAAAREATAREVQAIESGTAQAVPAAKKRNGGMFRSLRSHNFRLYASGGIISNVGTWMQRTAQDWLVLELTNGSAAALGVATALQFAPQLVLGMWGGVLADRYAKRPILITAQSLMGVLALTLGLLTVTGTAQVWHVYTMALLVGVISCLDIPTRQAFVVEMVGRDNLANALALNSSIFNLARVVGPALAGLLIYALGGTGPIFLLNSLTFAGVIASLLLMRRAELRTAEPVPRAKGQLRAGLRYVLDRRELLTPILLIAFMSMFAQSFMMSIALMAKEVYQAGASSFGLASSGFAVGALGGALLAARRVRPGRRLLIGGALAFGVTQIVAGLAPWYISYVVLLVPAGIALITVNTAANAIVQLATSAEMRGRVMGIYFLVFTGGAPIGAPLIGWVSELGGPRIGVVIGGIMTLVGTGLAVLLANAILRRRGSHAVVRGAAATAGSAR
ncbi:MFS transporter [Spongiactinospora gelatinilytica]|nr:MFS transporter [Spongiactinospora gelatinilytica]